MSTQFCCSNEKRRAAVRDQSIVNGIDYLEIASPDETRLSIHFLHPLPGQSGGIPAAPALHAKNIVIEGGTRITGIKVLKVHAQAGTLHVEVDKPGDFSWYTLKLVDSALHPAAPAGFDRQLAELRFSFKADCPSEIDCETVVDCPPESFVEPDIDYLAKDYATFRRLMLDRMTALMPDWLERNPADSQVMLVEMLASVGDSLSYYQDAVSTEAYLGTARKRVSVRRHARLLDYRMHDGCNARTWMQISVSTDVERVTAADPLPISTATKFLTSAASDSQNDSAVVFEAMHELHGLYRAHNSIDFYTWSDEQCCLPKGSTRATLREPSGGRLTLRVGDVLVFEEIIGPTTGLPADADPANRHVVRLTGVNPECLLTDTAGVIARDPAAPVLDAVTGQAIVDIEWSADDALPFPLCLSALVPDATLGTALKSCSVARGNVVLADHGESNAAFPLGEALDSEAFRPILPAFPVTQQGHARDLFGNLLADADGNLRTFDPKASASSALTWELRDTLPAVQLTDESADTWTPAGDLLSAGEFTQSFVTEVDETGVAQLRFGDGISGERPAGAFSATFRIGNGAAGNLGAETLTSMAPANPAVVEVRNPFAATGGIDPESIESARQNAPQAFRVQERAVTEADWADVAQRHPEVQRAAARFRWTGSWQTVYVAIDRARGLPVNGLFLQEMRAHLERYRIAGYDFEVTGPLFVPLDIALTVCVLPGYFRGNVKQSLTSAFRLFFDPDRWSFGQTVYLSQIYRAAMDVTGVASVLVNTFQRWGEDPDKEIELGMLKPALLEIIRLDNDPNFPENGKIDFTMEGGL